MIEDEDMEQPRNQYEREIEAGYLETKKRENTNTRPRRANTGKGVECLKMNFGGKTYDNKLTTSTGENKKYFMHDMQKLSVDVKFDQTTAKKGIKKHGESAVAATYKEYTQLEDKKVMGVLKPESLTRSQKKGALRAINLIKEKRSGKLKGRTCADG